MLPPWKLRRFEHWKTLCSTIWSSGTETPSPLHGPQISSLGKVERRVSVFLPQDTSLEAELLFRCHPPRADLRPIEHIPRPSSQHCIDFLVPCEAVLESETQTQHFRPACRRYGRVLTLQNALAVLCNFRNP